jgi:anti-anti-sigma factor
MTPPGQFALCTERPAEGILTVSIEGELDMRRSLEVRQELRAAVADHRADAVIVDLTGLDFIDSTGLAALVDVSRALKQADRAELVAACSRGQVKRVLALTHIDRIVCVVDSLDDAMSIVGGSVAAPA